MIKYIYFLYTGFISEMTSKHNKQSLIQYDSCANPNINDCNTCTVHATNGAGGHCYWNPTKENQTNETTCTVGECSAFRDTGYGSTCASNTPAPTKQTCSTPHPSPLQSSYSSVTNTPQPLTVPTNAVALNAVAPSTVAPNTPSPTTTTAALSSVESTFTDLFKDVFTNTTMTIIFWVSSAYVVYKFGSAIMSPRSLSAESSGQLTYSRTVDFILFGLAATFALSTYYQIPPNEKTNIFGWFLSWTYAFFNNPWSVLELFWFTVIFFILVYILRVPMAPDVKPVLVRLVEHKIWIFYATFAIIYFFKYVLNIPIVDIVFNNSVVRYFEDLPATTTAPTSSVGGTPTPTPTSYWDTLTKDVDSVFATAAPGTTPGTTTAPGTTPGTTTAPGTTTVPGSTSAAPTSSNKQVFNIGNNIYTYDEAQKVCQAFDADLASYDQIESAYSAGGEWCNYGWSADQMAFFPTQKSTWQRLQQNDDTKNACGRPGINGGYFSNPYIKFGANCYGVKPQQPEGWEPEHSSIISAAPTTPAESDNQRKMRKQAEINSFNDSEWSRYSNGTMNKSTTPAATTRAATTTPAATTRAATTTPAATTRAGSTTTPAATTRAPTTTPAATTRAPTTTPAATTRASSTTTPAPTTRAPTTTPAATTRDPTTTPPLETSPPPTTRTSKVKSQLNFRKDDGCTVM